MSSQGNVKVETAGSIRGGQKVWFLLKGDAFDVRNENDVVVPYVLVSNGFDGGTALRCTPTTIRVVCSNTLHMVIPSYDKADLGLRVRGVTKSAYVCRHVGNLKARVEEARKAMETYGKRLQDNRTLIDALSVRDMNSEAVQRFFLECYASQFGAIPANPKTKQEAKARTKAMEAVVACVKRFEKTELPTTGATAWGAFNAYTGWLQHDRKSRLKDAAAARELRLSSNLFGDNSDRSVEAFKVALQLAT